jgi:hypothetical protein
MKTNETARLSSNLAENELYQDEKRRKKQRIVRNEFERSGKYGMPLVKNKTST